MRLVEAGSNDGGIVVKGIELRNVNIDIVNRHKYGPYFGEDIMMKNRCWWKGI